MFTEFSESSQTGALRRSGAARSAIAIALVVGLPSLAYAQNGTVQTQSGDPNVVDRAAATSDDKPSEIVVTGTILRGAPPVGSAIISVDEGKIAETGATTANELLASVPQVTNLFNTVPSSRLSVAANQIQVVRPNLRNLASETSSSASTLVLFDGHRVSSVGVTQNAVDPDLMPTLAIERVEVVTDGGSATYGSDAVGGVINFITRKSFDGVKVQSRYGFADNYRQVDAGAIIGRDWGSGSIYAAYNYQHNDALFGRDRDFIRSVDWLSPSLTPRGRQCAPGNVQIGNNLYALPALTSNVPNSCDSSDDSAAVPRATRHGALLSLHQDLSPAITVDLRGFYAERKSNSPSALLGTANVAGVTQPAVDLRPIGIPFVIPASFRNFYYTPVPGQSPTAAQQVLFDLSPVVGRSAGFSRTKFQEWGANAEVAADLGSNWQLRTLFNYSRSNSEYNIQQVSPSLLNAFGSGPGSTTAAGTINFYNPGAGSADATNIAALINRERAGQGREELLDLRAILDGTLFTLPGGDVKLAVGYEYLYDNFKQRVVDDVVIGSIGTAPYADYNRDTHAAFGEIQIPIVGEGNRGFLYSATLAGSVRYDKFSDFGSTTNPKIGVNIKPVSWLGLRGNYSTSFNAPSPNDQLGALRNSASYFGFNAFVPPGVTPIANGVVALQGSNPGLRPQTAKTYSFGVDFEPMSTLRASVNYYNVRFKNVISIPSPNAGIFANFPNNVVSDINGVSLAAAQEFLNNSGAQGAASALATIAAGCTTPAACRNLYELVDFRQGNYGTIKVQGLDFAANFRKETSFGGFDAGVSGNYTLSRKSQTGAGAPVINELKATNIIVRGIPLSVAATGRLQLSASAGADFGGFRAQATLNHSAGFDVVRCDGSTTPTCRPSTTGVPTGSGTAQDRVKSFNTVNLFFKYAVPSDSALLKDLELNVNVNNVFDTDPPIYRTIGGSGYANGFTLGRLVQVGIAKKF